MIFQVTMKCPDSLDDAIYEACPENFEATREQCEKWFKYGECLTLEIDTVADTIKVVQNNGDSYGFID